MPNPDFGGYVAFDRGAADVVARFQVPAVRCGGTRHSALGPGAFLLSGPESHESLSAADLIVACRQGKVVMVESLETRGNERFFQRTVRAGDVLIAHISEKPSGEVVQLTDTAPGRRFTLTVRDKGTFADEELVGNYALSDENDKPLPLPPSVAPIRFSSVRINGAPLGRTTTTIYDMTTAQLVRQMTPGSLGGPRRDAFALRRVAR